MRNNKNEITMLRFQSKSYAERLYISGRSVAFYGKRRRRVKNQVNKNGERFLKDSFFSRGR